MAVDVQGTVVAPLTNALTEPTGPVVGPVLTVGVATVVNVGPYTNSSAVAQTVSAITVSNAVGLVVNSTNFNEAGVTGTDTSVVQPGSTVSIDVNGTADAGVTSYSFTIDDLTVVPV